MTPGSAAEPYRQDIEEAISKGLSARRIWQDLVGEYGCLLLSAIQPERAVLNVNYYGD
jgi:hypothetical protein